MVHGGLGHVAQAGCVCSHLLSPRSHCWLSYSCRVSHGDWKPRHRGFRMSNANCSGAPSIQARESLEWHRARGARFDCSQFSPCISFRGRFQSVATGGITGSIARTRRNEALLPRLANYRTPDASPSGEIRGILLKYGLGTSNSKNVRSVRTADQRSLSFDLP